MGIFTKEELHARHEIELENYTMKLQIESRLTADIAINHITPAAVAYQSELIDNVAGLKLVLGAAAAKKAAKTQLNLIASISSNLNEMNDTAVKMNAARKKANELGDARKSAIAYCDKVKPMMDKVRAHADALEQIIDDELWPLPKLRELLFTR